MFEEIRREYEFGVGSIAGVASRKCQNSRQLAKQSLAKPVADGSTGLGGQKHQLKCLCSGDKLSSATSK